MEVSCRWNRDLSLASPKNWSNNGTCGIISPLLLGSHDAEGVVDPGHQLGCLDMMPPNCNGMQTGSLGHANRGSFRLTFTANKPRLEPTRTANELTFSANSLQTMFRAHIRCQYDVRFSGELWPPEHPIGIPAPDAAPNPGCLPRLGDLSCSTGHGRSHCFLISQLSAPATMSAVTSNTTSPVMPLVCTTESVGGAVKFPPFHVGAQLGY